MVCNHFCQRPVLVIKSRGSPSGIQNAAAFPSFISYLSVLNLTAAGLALSVEHLTEERKVVGSILLRPD